MSASTVSIHARRRLKLPALAAVACAAFTLAACTGSRGAQRPDPEDVKVAGPKVGDAPGKGEAPKISTRAQLLFEDAIKAYEAQKKAGRFDYPSLEKKFQAAAAEDKNLAEADYNLGVLAEQQGKKDAAVRHYQTALKKKPTLKQAAENLAVILQNEGNIQGAVDIYRSILESYPDDASSRARLAEIYRQQGDHERALQLARESLTRDPKTLVAYKVMMRSYLERNQLSLARLVALRALKLDENDPELHHTVGLILLKEDERDKAMLQFKRAIEARADYLPAHVILARMALENEDYSGAEEHLRKILQVDGKNAEAHLNLGVAYKGMGDYDKALQEYEIAEKLKPDLAAVILNRAIIIHRHKGDARKGLELYKRYLSTQGPSLAADAPVFALVREAEEIIRVEEENKRAEEEARRMEAEMKRQEEEAKRLEAQQKAEEERLKKEEERAKQTQEALQAGGAGDKGKTAPASDNKKKDEKKPEPEKKPAPAPAKSNDEPGDEPLDNL